MAQGPGPFLAPESMWPGSRPGLTSTPRAPSKVSKAWGWCHQERAAESPGAPVGTRYPCPPLFLSSGAGGCTAPQCWASNGSGAIDKLGGLPSLAERPPTISGLAESQSPASFRNTAPVRWDSLAPFIAPSAHRGPGVRTHPMPAQAPGPAPSARLPRPLYRGQLSKAPSPWPPARWDVFALQLHEVRHP